MFNPIEGTPNFPQMELAIGEFWKRERIYEKSLEQRADAPPFVFYEGPPTANGMPHPGHCLTRAIKDLFPRYRTMRGYRCERKAGWDTHGLPVEVEVCKELGIHSKEEIENYGVEPFIQKCQQSVWRYMREWERMTERIGFWVDLKNAYATYHQSFVESVWWSLKNLFDRGLLYQGHKIVWWWAQGGTALSAGEVGLGYRQVADPSVYVKFPLYRHFVSAPKDDPTGVWSNLVEKHKAQKTRTYFLAWTTTPWTLPSNQFLAINPRLTYALVADEQDESTLLVLADALVETIAVKTKRSLVRLETFPGSDLLKWGGYIPPFDGFTKDLPTPVGIDAKVGWGVVPADFVTTESGTGIVHIAPAFGEDDYEVLVTEQQRFEKGQGPKLINCVGPDGKFTNEAPEYCRGRWVKDCDKDIIRDLKQRGLLFHQEQYLHDYPFCWRAEQDPLIQYPRQSWFIRTSNFKDEMLANNAKINWLPEHIKDGRFGKFLETNVDWALSRERYWGTPLPIWKCQQTGKMEAIGSYDELLAKPGVRGMEAWQKAKAEKPDLPDDLMVHKPYIDEIVYDSPFAEGAHMRRVPEVIDCWYDSGAMPFAQWGYRGEAPLPSPPRRGEGAGVGAVEKFHQQFPADFISEAIDQTRGWFYSQLAISTLMFGGPGAGDSGLGKNANSSTSSPQSLVPSPHPYPHPFRNCIVLGHMLGEDGQKMSKSKRNYLPPDEIFDRYGADALRWFFFASQPPWTTIRYNEQAIKDSIPEFLLRLWNVYSFFVIYANIDEFDPGKEAGGWGLGAGNQSLESQMFAEAKSYRPVKERGELDRWILSELNRTCAAVVERMDVYDNFGACQRITEFVDALSNWYVRRSRDRFWAADKRGTEKLDAYWTLYEALVTAVKLVAPFVPFVAETMWQNLAVEGLGARDLGLRKSGPAVSSPQPPVPSPHESVHLCDFPAGDATVIDVALSERMNLVRLIASLGRNARNAASLKVRQPLAKVQVILADTRHQAWLEQHAAVIEEELNVRQLEFCDDPTKYVEHEVVPNFKLLGPKLGKLLPKVKQWLGQQTGAALLENIRDNGQIDLTLDGQAIALTREEVEVRIRPRAGWTSANDQGVVVVLSTELTPELIAEGLARDAVRIIQDRRKEIGCEYTDRIELGVVTVSKELRQAIERFGVYIIKETLAAKLGFEPLIGVEPVDAKLGDGSLEVFVRVVR